MIMARLLALATVGLVLVGTPAATGKATDLYSLRYGAAGNALVRYDPVRLVPSGSPIELGHFGQAWSISPDRRRFVAAAGWRPAGGKPAAIAFVDLLDGRVEGTMVLAGELRRVIATAWVRGRVLVVVSGSDSTTVYAVDPDRRVAVGQVELHGSVVLGERAQSGLVLLLAAPDRIGPVTLAVVDQRPRARRVVLERISAGTTTTGEGEARHMTIRRPALALGPSQLRAFVLGAGEPAASIDLRTLTTRYAPLRRPTAAQKRVVDGAVRSAAALPDGRIAVWGFNYGASGSVVGLSLVDPRDWSQRRLDSSGGWYRVEGGLVFARGAGGVGLRIIRPSGAVVDLFRTGSVANVVVVGPRAFVTFFGTKTKAAIVELGTGRVARHTVPARPLIGSGQPIVG
jgi:hypothetical protein